jgi:hypothetical protein
MVQQLKKLQDVLADAVDPSRKVKTSGLQRLMEIVYLPLLRG